MDIKTNSRVFFTTLTKLTNPNVFYTTLTKLNKRFSKFNETGGKVYTRDDKEVYIKICNSEYKDVITALKTSHIKVTNGKEK